MNCKWDPEAETYLVDGEKCRVDEYGDPTNHCTARRTCSQHVGWGELTCARCIGRTRNDLRQILERTYDLPEEALDVGAVSEAAMLAMPAADPRTWLERRLASIGHLDHWLSTGKINDRKYIHARSTIDDDEFHPYNVLTRWHMMLAEDYGIDLPATKMTISDSAAFLDRILGRVAQDEEQDFRLLRDELRRCRNHLESVLHDSLQPERGAFCPTCEQARVKAAEEGKKPPPAVRLGREYPHFCWEDECEQIHYDTDEADRWVCPRNPQHAWTVREYENWVEERTSA